MDWQRRNEGRLAVGVVTFMVVTLLAVVAWAGGLNATLTESRFECPDDPSVVFCSKAVVDGSNNLIDFSGANNMTYTEAFDDAAWTKTNVTVTADQARGPEDSDADLLTPTAADSHVYQDDAGSAAGETHTCAFDLRSVIGNVDLSIHVYSETHTAIRGTEAITVTPYWHRYYVQGLLIAGDTDIGCTIGGNTTWSTGENIYAVRASSQMNDEWRPGAGVYYPVLTTVTKPVLDLAQNNNPTTAFAHVQMQGNKGPAREYDGVNQDYRLAHDPAINIFDTSHTMTFAVLQDTGAAGFDRVFEHEGATGGVDVYSQNLANWRVRYTAAGGGTLSVDCPANATNDGMLHFVQIVRNGNDVTCHLDGTAGATVDVTGYGDDVAAVIYLGSENANYLDGQISYTVIRSRALSADERAEEREDILGIATNWSDVNAWDFERSTVAYKQFSAGGAHPVVSHMSEVAVDHPRVAGKGGGMLVEGQSTNVLEYSQQFQQAGSWSVFNASIVADSIIALDGTTTVDILHEDATAATLHYLQQAITTTDTRTYTASIYSSPVNRDWIRLSVTGDADGYYFNVDSCTVGSVVGGALYARAELQPDGFCRCSMTWTSSSTGAKNFQIFVGEADGDVTFDGLNQDSLYVWNAQIEEQPFPTSPILTLAAAVTRTADDMTIDPHPAGTNNYILPLEFAPNTNADKLTMYGEFKCEWSDNTDIGSTQRSLIEISGNTGTAGQQRNRVWFEVTQTGELYGYLRDDSSTAHYVDSAANPVDYSEWFSVRLVLDFTDLSRMDMWIAQPPNTTESNAGMAYTANTGAVSFDTTNTLIRIGQQYNDNIESFCHNRSLRINGQEIRP